MKNYTSTYLLLFHTHYGALYWEKIFTQQSIFCQLMPSPRSLSASCGISLSVKESWTCIHHFLQEEEEHIDRIYLWDEKSSYRLVYENPLQ